MYAPCLRITVEETTASVGIRESIAIICEVESSMAHFVEGSSCSMSFHARLGPRHRGDRTLRDREVECGY